MTDKSAVDRIKKIYVLTEEREKTKAAEDLARRLNLDVFYRESESEDTEEDTELMLRMDDEGLSLAKGSLRLRGDFTHMLPRLKTANLRNELLIRAAKIKKTEKNLTAVDATAGMGEDSLLLAAAGFSVRLYEYNPVIAALLRDTMKRAETVPELSEITARMQLYEEDSMQELRKLAEMPDVVLLDPMFPARQKSALVRKKFQLLHHLEQPCVEESELIEAAMAAHPHKIVIKRPPKGPYLAGVKPGFSIKGKGVRYDCIVIPHLN